MKAPADPWGSRPIVGIGQKMMLSYLETVEYARALDARAALLEDVNVFLLPQAPALAPVQAILAATSISVGAQDVHWTARGAWTGAISPLSLVEIGCRYAEVGHVERRRWFGETDALCGAKIAAALDHGLVPVLCVGWRDRADDQDGAAAAKVADELDDILAAAEDPAAGPLVVAYEPAWAIGCEQPAGRHRIESVATALRERLADWVAPSAVLYGGSVTAASVRDLSRVDGVFVGRAARRIEDLMAIAAAVSEHLTMSESHS